MNEQTEKKMHPGCIVFIIIFILGGLIPILFIVFESDEQKAKSKMEHAAWQAKMQAKEIKEQKDKEMYGELIHAKELYNFFKDHAIEANKACNKKPVQIEGIILEMGTNSEGNFIDLHTTGVFKTEAADIRVFLAEGEWNNNAITRIKKRNTIVAGGLCYGQTEVYGIKTKIVIGNASILRVNGEFL